VAASAATKSAREELEELLASLDDDFPAYAGSCLKIVNKQAIEQPFTLNAPQERLWARIKREQIDRDRPVRVIILKSRQIGFSTFVQGMLVHRATRRRNRRAYTVSRDRDATANLWAMAHRMHGALPVGIPGLKPPLSNMTRNKLLYFGEPSRVLQTQGNRGLDSQMLYDTAGEQDSARGSTYHDVHLSEVAHWESERKMTGILNGVPRLPGTMVVLETTANAANFFKRWWERAERGESEYIAHFVGWLEDPTCVKPFENDAERERLVADLGNEEYGGEEELELLNSYGASLEQLYWRRVSIVDQHQGDINLFHQEYPTTAEEAFILSGEHVFPTVYIQRAIKAAREAPEAERGTLKVDKQKEGVRARIGTVDVPETVVWVPESAGTGGMPTWRVWEHPRPDGDYVVALDPMGGDVNDAGERAHHGLQVVDHRTGRQVARWRSQIDPDLAGMELLKAAIFYNRGWAVPETTGGYGGAIARRLYEDFKYPFTYRKRDVSQLGQKAQKKIGWDTTLKTKPWLEETFTEMLREGTHGIIDLATALELASYVRDEKGKTGPAEGAFSDLLMAYMIAQFVRLEKPPKRRKAADRSTVADDSG
jgi:hypothetical protein